MLTDRQKIILYSIVDDFLNVLTPISSKHLIDKYNLDISSATVRNDMARLEAEGFLTKPHASAGRIPSRKALRHYIGMLTDQLSGETESGLKRKSVLADGMEHNEMSQALADFFSGMTSYLTQVSMTEEDELVKGIYLTPIATSTLLVIIVLESGAIKKIPVGMSEDITIPDLEKLGNELNFAVVDQPLSKMAVRMIDRTSADSLNILKADIIDGITDGINGQKLISGRSGFNHLIHQINEDTSTLQLLYNDMESDQLNELIDLNTIDGVDVFFGDELNRNYDSISVITTNFDIFGRRANLMVIGPEIMSYKEVIRLLYSFRNQERERE
ncbi:heat-inducible transcriptional repressor HrcA [Salinicoccus carnicancri]|uniref:heat-inducible transcriptional repressor HrcA n=1 Tax=Salinicoccus carnicancri TaxID=558170 RepID=UPI000310C238|nr:heat-inducible transcriptional repressor HrcA [Salinicoccus carnicancri]